MIRHWPAARRSIAVCPVRSRRCNGSARRGCKLQAVRFDISFDPTFQPGYAVATTQPLFRTVDHDAAIDLHGRVMHDPAGRTGGNLGFRYRGRFEGQPIGFGLEGGVENRWLEDVERYTMGAELRLSALEVRAHVFDDVAQHPASHRIATRRLDAYDLKVNARIPYVPWAWLTIHRFWQIAANSETAVTQDRISVRLTPYALLEIEAGTQNQAELRSWFAQLRWRIALGD